MRVLILTDRSFAARERSLIARLEVGLADEGVRVVHAVPRRVSPDTPGIPGELFARSVTYEDRGPRLFRRARARQFIADLSRARDGPSEPPIDVVHVFGEQAWPFAVEVATLLGVGLAVDVWRADLAGAAARVRLDPEASGRSPVVLFAVGPSVERLVREESDRSGGGAVRSAPWGVHAPAHGIDLFVPDRVPAVLIVGSGRDPDALAAALGGLASLRPGPEPLIFADAEMCGRARAWPVVRRLGLAGRFTLVPDVEARRDVTLGTDLVVFPEAMGEHRSITLDAMALGALVVAAEDPMDDILIEGRTARLVERPVADRWAGVLDSVFSDPGAARALATSAREFARANARATAHVAAVMDAYEWMTTGDTLPFSGATRA